MGSRYQLSVKTSYSIVFLKHSGLSTGNRTCNLGWGLMHFGARWLDSYLKRWNQPDTIIMEYNDPQSFDRYAFVRNNPVNRIDPTGYMDV